MPTINQYCPLKGTWRIISQQGYSLNSFHYYIYIIFYILHSIYHEKRTVQGGQVHVALPKSFSWAPIPPPWLRHPLFLVLNGMTFEGQMRKLNDKYWRRGGKFLRDGAKFVILLWQISRYAPVYHIKDTRRFICVMVYQSYPSNPSLREDKQKNI